MPGNNISPFDTDPSPFFLVGALAAMAYWTANIYDLQGKLASGQKVAVPDYEREICRSAVNIALCLTVMTSALVSRALMKMGFFGETGEEPADPIVPLKDVSVKATRAQVLRHNTNT